MKVWVERDLCVTEANCIGIAPGVFELDDEDKSIVINPKAASETVIWEAAKACPVFAIFIADDDGNVLFPFEGARAGE
ncbi:MAG: ferredoxin [Chloroflexi bacterium]|nr:ferredoxin [Chloroflexota bacterium]